MTSWKKGEGMKNNNSQIALITLGLGLTLLLAMGAFFMFRTGAFSMPIIPLIFALLVLLGISMAGLAIWQQSNREKAKPKHDMDMYAVIDRLVDDLNADEADYLWRKLNTAERQDTADTLAALLDEREQQHG